MTNFEINPEKIMGEFFNSMQKYVQNLMITNNDLMNGLYNFHSKAWEVPKKYKSN